MKEVSREELLHIANLAELELKEEDVENYLANLQDILNFADVINNANTEGLNTSTSSNEAKNVFRKDEIKEFEDNKALLQNAPEMSMNMFKVPKVL